jgi:hypothetical protein
MTRILTGVLAVITLAAAGRAEDSVPELVDALKKANAFRPPARDLVWRQIPWHTDPALALRQAREEKRPLFVWLAGGRDRDGTPLERC